MYNKSKSTRVQESLYWYTLQKFTFAFLWVEEVSEKTETVARYQGHIVTVVKEMTRMSMERTL